MDTICNVGFGHDLKCMESEEMPRLLPLFEEVLEISINSSLYGAFEPWTGKDGQATKSFKMLKHALSMLKDMLGTRKRWFEGQLHKLDGMLDEIIDAVKQGTQSGSSNSLPWPRRSIGDLSIDI